MKLKLRLDKTQILIAITILSFLLLCIIFYLIFLPALRQSRLLSRQTKDKKENLLKMQRLTSEYNLLGQEIDKTKEKLNTLKHRLFWERDISRLLNELTQLASGLRIEFVSLKPEAESRLGQKEEQESPDFLVAQVPISVLLRSSYPDLVRFLKRIEEADKFIKVDSLNIESDRRDIYRHNIRITLSILVEDKEKL